jgi:hypothetical protein
MSASIRIKRGLFANLPADATLGELLGTTDTKQIFMGNGTGNALIELCPTGSGGGSGTVINRYEIGGSGSMSYVHATGAIGDVTLSQTNNAAVLAATNGAHIFSVSIHFTAAQMTGVTSATVDFGSNTAISGNIPGTGLNNSYATMFPPQWMIWVDVTNGRTVKTTATGTLNANYHTITFGNLTALQPIWVNLTF